MNNVLFRLLCTIVEIWNFIFLGVLICFEHKGFTSILGVSQVKKKGKLYN